MTDNLRGHSAPGTAATAKAATATGKSAAAAGKSAAAARTAATEPVIASRVALLSAEEWIEIVFSKPVTLVASPTATPFVKTHLCKQTFESPHDTRPDSVDEPHPAFGKATTTDRSRPFRDDTYTIFHSIANTFAR